MTAKFVWNGIKINGEFFKGHYTKGPYTATSGIPEGTITVYMSGYKSLPRIEGLNIENDSDIMTDYFETDTVRIFPGTMYYEEAAKAHKAHEIHFEKRAIKQYEKMAEKYKGTRHETYYLKEIAEHEARLAKLAA